MRKLAIAYGNSCTAKKWTNKTVTLDELYERTKSTIRTTETVSEYRKMKRNEKDQAKDRGGFVGGHLRNNRRLKQNVAYRSMLTSDLDHAERDFISRYEMLTPYESILYTTHGHTKEVPRIRLIIPFTRDVTPDEYVAIARFFASEWGIDQFDPCSYQVNQLMYWPTTPADGEYVCIRTEGSWLDPDDYLAKHPNWKDVSLLPTGKGESEVRANEIKKAEDPLTKDNLVGVFCRCYSVTDAIEEFLSDIYCPSDIIPGRYQYIPADSKAGVEILDGGRFLHSHHATDPAYDLNLNAFDLVRIHKFGDMDEKKSFNSMCEFALSLDKVKLKLAEEREAGAGIDFSDSEADSWKASLRYQRNTGLLENSVWNEMLILNNDPDFQNFAFNELAGRVQVTGPLPWSRPSDNKFWRDADTAQLKALLDVKYVSFSSRNHDVAFTKIADDRRFHPVRDYLDNLPKWDGKSRVETLLIDCLEADDTEYVRTVTRKTLAAAVARIYHPGIKFDSVLVFDGVQGIGKSTLFKDLAGEEFYSETLSLTDMNDKSGAEKLQGFWIVEIAELAGMKKADIEKVKAFLSTSDDKYRPSYGRTVESHPIAELQPFSKEQALELIEKIEFREDEPDIKAKFKLALEKNLFNTHREFANNPLLLTIMLMTFEQYAEIPSKMHIFYREAYSALSQKHDANKGGYKRQLKTGLNADRFSDYFSEFCMRTYHDEKFELTDAEFEKYFNSLKVHDRFPDENVTASAFLKDLLSAMCLMYYESAKYAFTHRSFQEYFCALFFSKQKDKTLKHIGDFFENRTARMRGDKTFSMLYDMIPDHVEEYIFIPFIEDIVSECEEADGYWTYLKKYHPTVSYGYGETSEFESNIPESFLLNFILTTFGLNPSMLMVELPMHEEFITESYDWVLYPGQEDGEILVHGGYDNLVSISHEAHKRFSDEELEIQIEENVGYSLEFSIEEVLSEKELYEDIIRTLDDEKECPLKYEYIKLKSILSSLKERHQTSGDDFFDLF